MRIKLSENLYSCFYMSIKFEMIPLEDVPKFVSIVMKTFVKQSIYTKLTFKIKLAVPYQNISFIM